MWRNYLNIALRNLKNNKFFSVIIISGLCIGVTSCLLMVLFIKLELSYENIFDKKDRIARVIMEYSMGGNVNKGNYTSTKVGPSLKRNFPEVQDFVRMTNANRLVGYKEKIFSEKRFLYADSNFFQVFDLHLQRGNLNTALLKPNSVILTASSAKKYFEDEDPIGKTLKVSSKGVEYIITGVMFDCPENTHLKFDFLASFSSLGIGEQDTYWNANYNTYLLLRTPESIKSLQAKIPVFMQKEMKGTLTAKDYLTYELEPLTRIHLYSEYKGFEPNGSITYLYIVGMIAVLILAIACFTFINLTTAKSGERAKEIGIRKITGAEKTQIFWQFMGESFVTVSISVFISFLLTFVCLPYFNELVHRNISPSQINGNFLPYLLIITLVMTVLGGAYPALIISGFQPIKVLKGSFKNTGKGLVLRKSLFVFQFAISVFLITSAIVIQKQLSFIQHVKLGFDKDHVLIIPSDAVTQQKSEALLAELKNCPGVVDASGAHFEPSAILGGYNMSKPGMPAGAALAINAGGIDQAYINTNQIQIISGENITKKDIEETSHEDYTKNYFHFILNESAAKQLGWTPQQAIGQKMSLDETRPGIVKAVVKDFHFQSLHNPIKPLVLFPDNYAEKYLVRISGNDITLTLAQLEKSWKTIVKHRPFEFTFQKDSYDAMYRNEIQLGKAVSVFTLIGIVLACLGLLGLSTYNIQQRTKEIGILKVIGAPIANIIVRLSKNFIWLVMISIGMAVPLAMLTMQHWLQNFSYATQVGTLTYVAAALISIAVTLLTLGFGSIKTALANPVKNLRTE